SELSPRDSELLVLPGAALWDAGGGEEFADAARAFLAAGVPVAAICGATVGLARAGLLDDRPHTSAALAYLQGAPGYRGAEQYRDERAVAADGLITAGPDSPVQFAAATLVELGLIDDELRAAYEGVFSSADASRFPELMAARA
ncbi:MAG: DJ-1/PfpI family protein, partial [Patulibacter sp.]|nr:DJ-1/PfpI family protein [Patulibacter sp.]